MDCDGGGGVGFGQIDAVAKRGRRRQVEHVVGDVVVERRREPDASEVVHDALHGAEVTDAPCVEENDEVEHVEDRRRRLVDRGHDRAPRRRQRFQLRDDCVRRGRVEPRRGLVEHQHGGIEKELVGHRDAFLLTARNAGSKAGKGDAADVSVGALEQPERDEQSLDARKLLGLGHLAREPHQGCKLERLAHRLLREEMVLLEHVADLALGRRSRNPVTEDNGSLCGLKAAAQDLEKGRLASSRRAENGDHCPRRNAPRDPFENLQRLAVETRGRVAQIFESQIEWLGARLDLKARSSTHVCSARGLHHLCVVALVLRRRRNNGHRAGHDPGLHCDLLVQRVAVRVRVAVLHGW
eukprot:Amastigsp_a177202_111.p2 type:complete len:353 gc:universal Amastigsp_a177202_111:972-2030(+)